MNFFIIIANSIISIVAGIGIYQFSDSFFWAIIGSFILTGSASANPIIALFGYPAVEWFFGDGLTIYSTIIICVNLLQMLWIFFHVSKSE
jgi:hypothetical protein